MRSESLAAAVKDLGKKIEVAGVEMAFSEEGYKNLFKHAKYPVVGV